MTTTTTPSPAQAPRRTRPRKRYPPPYPGRWAWIPEAAEYLTATYRPVSVRTMRRWVEEGRVPAHRVGSRRIQIDLNELDAMPEVHAPWAAGADDRLIRQVAAVLRQLPGQYREKLAALLLNAGGDHDAA